MAGQLAEYGFNCIRLADDRKEADFLAYHKDGDKTLKIQLTSRMKIAKKYTGKGLYICFPHQDSWYLVKHSKLVKFLSQNTNYLSTKSWIEQGMYSAGKPNAVTKDWLADHRL